MSRRALSYLSIAERCAAQGEKGRAIITVVNALRYHPECMDDEPSPIEFLARNFVPGFEEELSRLQARYPAFGERLARALYACGKEDVVRHLQVSFKNYCVDQMKMTHASYGSSSKPMRQFEAEVPASPVYVQPSPADAQEALKQLNTARRYTASEPTPRSSQNFRRVARDEAASSGYVAVTRNSQFVNPIDPLTHADQSLMMALQSGVPEVPRGLEPPAVTSMEFDGMRIPLDEVPSSECNARLATMPSISELSDLREMPQLNLAVTPKSAPAPHVPTREPENLAFESSKADDLLVDTDYLSQVALSSISRHRHDSENEMPAAASPAVAAVRRFDRLKALDAEERKTNTSFIDDGTQRVIYDFDNIVTDSLGSAGYKSPTELTPYRTFEEERAEFLAANPSRPRFSFSSSTMDPFERVAEMTRSLDTDTPSVTPADPEPKRFSISAAQLAVCVAICVISVFVFITWKSSEPELARQALRGLGDTFIQASEAGEADPAGVTAERADLTVKPFADAFRSFFDVWHALYFKSSEDYTFDESMPVETAAQTAAKILWLTSHDKAREARILFEDTSRSTWRGAEYFKRFSEALLAEAEHELPTAARRYAYLQNSPLAGFALTRLALLAFQSEHPEVISTYEKIAFSTSEPLVSQCTRSLLSHGNIGGTPGWAFDALTPAAQDMCGIAAALRSAKLGIPLSEAWRSYLANLQTTPELDVYRIEALVEGALLAGNIREAAAWFKQFNVSSEHPIRIRLQHAILQHAFDSDDLSALNALSNNIPADISPFEAARLIDTDDLSSSTTWASYFTRFAAKRPSANLANDKAYLAALDNAWNEAVAGDYVRSLAALRSIRGRYPDAWEPLMLQSELLYRTGSAKDAAGNYEVRALHGEGGGVSIVMSNLYLVRAGLPVNPMAYALLWMPFSDPELESARCEILHAMHAYNADRCSSELASRKVKRITKTAWFAKNASRAPQSDLNRNGTGALSVPGYHLRLARVKLASGAVRDSVHSFTDAILYDPTTQNEETIYELEQVFVSRKRRYDGHHAFESLIPKLESRGVSRQVLAAAHLAAAEMYQPSTGNSLAKQHLLKSIELIGDNERALLGMIRYYDGKDKQEQLLKWQRRLRDFENPAVD